MAVPGVPQGLTAQTGSFFGEISLNWNDLTDTLSYNIYRTTTPGTGYTLVASTDVSDYLDTGLLLHSTTYYYVVAGVNLDGEGPFSSEVSATTLAPMATAPRAPTGLTAFPGPAEDEATIGWSGNAAADVIAWRLKRGTAEGGPYTEIAAIGVETTQYIDSGLNPGSVYYYVLTADNGLESANSNEVELGAASTYPDPPSSLIAITGDFEGQINVLWTVVIGADGYHVYRATDEAGPYVLLAFVTVTRYFDTDLDDDELYYYKVAPVQL